MPANEVTFKYPYQNHATVVYEIVKMLDEGWEHVSTWEENQAEEPPSKFTTRMVCEKIGTDDSLLYTTFIADLLHPLKDFISS